jgi:indole-3-glycerol phosphate synthase/phosphoribosylanthranilate isomerase
MREENMELAVRRLVFGTVKICGLTSREETRIAYEAGASYGGVIFASQSPRGMDVSSALEITSANPLPMTGVFVNEEIEKIASITEFLNLAVVQLHGDESPEYISDLRRKIPENTEIWRAKRVKDSIRGIDRAGANRVLLDTFDEKSRGGTGKTFDWLLLEGIDDKENTILSGGITEQNVCRAMAAGTYAVDVCSGVEFFGKPGKKDPEKIENLFKRLRGA